ncbi:MAG: hypothetical protein KGI38_10860 [Thaumarchaeota archaeon]|nr:hypothetical protein [Nitrososphaerota archaeon]
MAASGLSVINLSIDALAFAIAAISLYFVSQQKPSHYPYVKSLLILVHVFFEGVVLLEILRNIFTSDPFLEVYTILATSFILWDVILLTVIAYSVYVRPGGRGALGRLRSIFLRWPHGFVLAAFIVFIGGAEVYLAAGHPYTVVPLTSLDGAVVPSTKFDNTFLAVSLLTLVFFLAYPTTLLIRETLQVKDHDIRRALVVLPFCWVGIGSELLVFNGYLVAIGYDLVAVGYAIAALVFGVAATIFRRASLLSSFFEPLPGVVSRQGPTLLKEAGSPLDVSMPVLLEVDPSTNYEAALTGYANEKISAGGLVYAFTSKGSPVYNSLAEIRGVRFYLMTSHVSYPKSSDKENELLVPQNDMAVLLDLLDKTTSSTSGTPISVVFDNISDFVLYLGFESSYKFVKQANEILDRPKVSSVYLMTIGAHDERVLSLTKSLFRMHAIYDSQGLRMTRGSGATPAPG